MQINKLRALHGPNIHSHQPVFVMELDLKAEDGLTTETILRLAEQAQDDFSALGYTGWEGGGGETWKGRGKGTSEGEAKLHLGHIVAQTACRLTHLTEVPATLGANPGAAL